MKSLPPLILACALAGAALLHPDPEREAVAQAVYDYVDALYQVDPARIERSVHPDLAKRGFVRDEGGAYRERQMTYGELVDLAGRWNREGRLDPAAAPREVVVLDVLDQTATAKLTAAWGVDYLHLAKYDGRWQIVNVLWQVPPPPGEAE
jgi:hypothetical protein